MRSPYERRAGVSRGFVIITVILLLAGAAAGVYINVRSQAAVNAVKTASDILFAQASLMIMWGMCKAIGNAKMFTSFTYGFRQFHAVFRGKPQRSEEMKEDYLQYRKNRPVKAEIAPCFAVGAVLLILSLAVTFIQT